MRRLYRWYRGRFVVYNSRIAYLQSQSGRIEAWEHRYLSETLISDIWQSWCLFSRALLFNSIRGAKCRDGSVLAARAGDNSWMRLGYESSTYKSGGIPKHAGHAAFAMRKEPTWGDIDCFVKIVMGLKPANEAVLLAAYGGNFRGVKDLQRIRNCCAHKNIENIFDVRQMGLTYMITSRATPVDIAWSYKQGGTSLAIESWLHETIVIADLATANG